MTEAILEAQFSFPEYSQESRFMSEKNCFFFLDACEEWRRIQFRSSTILWGTVHATTDRGEAETMQAGVMLSADELSEAPRHAHSDQPCTGQIIQHRLLQYVYNCILYLRSAKQCLKQSRKLKFGNVSVDLFFLFLLQRGVVSEIDSNYGPSMPCL